MGGGTSSMNLLRLLLFTFTLAVGVAIAAPVEPVSNISPPSHRTTLTAADPFVFNFTTTNCYDGNSPLSSCDTICQVGKPGFSEKIDNQTVQIHYSGFVLAKLTI